MDKKVKEIVKDYIVNHLDKSEPEFEVYTLMKCKILYGWKYLVFATFPDSMYYELTYNGDKKEWVLIKSLKMSV